MDDTPGSSAPDHGWAAPMSQAPASGPAPVNSPLPGALPSTEAPDLRSEALYLNRELSWLEFNARVLAEAESESVPLLERLKFHAIVSSNLDEFFMVRVAGLKQQLTGEVDEMGPDGMTVGEQLGGHRGVVFTSSRRRSRRASRRSSRSWPSRHRLFASSRTSHAEALAELDARFHNEVFPILTPIAIDPGHPFPHVRNRSLNLGVMFTREGTLEHGFGVVQVPLMLPRLLGVNGAKTPNGQPAARAFVLLEDLIARHVGDHLPGRAGQGPLRLPRHAQLRHRDRRRRGGGPPSDDPAGAPPPRARQRRAPRGGRATLRRGRSRSWSKR